MTGPKTALRMQWTFAFKSVSITFILALMETMSSKTKEYRIELASVGRSVNRYVIPSQLYKTASLPIALAARSVEPLSWSVLLSSKCLTAFENYVERWFSASLLHGRRDRETRAFSYIIVISTVKRGTPR